MIEVNEHIFASFSEENIKELSRRQIILSERRICELAEIAEAAVEYGKTLRDAGVYEILSLISEKYEECELDLSGGILPENKNRLEKIFKSLNAMDKAYFADLYTEISAKNGMEVLEQDFLLGADSGETFVYVKNAYADEAYDVFSQEFDDPRVRYARDFREAARLVSDGTVTYCLFPLEEKGSRLASIAELLYRSELKINSVIPVFGIDGTADMKYALVSRHFNVPVRDPDDDRYLEIRISDDSSPRLSELLSAAESYGIRVYRVNTMTFDTEDGKRGYYSVVFSGENVDFTELLVYLTLFASEYTAVGIYKNLES